MLQQVQERSASAAGAASSVSCIALQKVLVVASSVTTVDLGSNAQRSVNLDPKLQEHQPYAALR